MSGPKGMNIRPTAAELARREAQRRTAAAESAYSRLLGTAGELTRSIEQAGGAPSTRLPAQLSDLANWTGNDPVERANAWEAALEEARLRVDALRVEVGRAASRAEAKESEVASLLAKLVDDGLTEATAGKLGPDRDHEIQRTLDTLLERTGSVFQGDEAWPELRERAKRIGEIEDPARQRNELAALKVVIGERVAKLNRRRHWTESVEALLDSAAHVSGERVKAVLVDLRALRETGEPVELAPYAERLAEAVAVEEAEADRDRATEVVLRTLEELGYEVSPKAMGTALVKDGRLVIQRHPGDEHGVEVRTAEASGGTHLRTEVVRLRPAEGEQARRRDYEREEAWCREYDVIRAHLAEEGYRTDMMMRRQPGETPMRTIVRENARRRNGGGAGAGRELRREESE